jgi:hypothetical protein
MSGTNFYFDHKGNCKDPGQAIALLQSPESNTMLSSYWPGVRTPRQVILLQNTALLMMGITEYLQAALLRDYNNGDGIMHLETAGEGTMKIWYVRRRASLETKSVVIIASFPLYWAGQHTNYGGKLGWQDMYPNSYINAMSLNSLANVVLPTGSGVTAWW